MLNDCACEELAALPIDTTQGAALRTRVGQNASYLDKVKALLVKPSAGAAKTRGFASLLQ
jgi:hypothetical protein